MCGPNDILRFFNELTFFTEAERWLKSTTLAVLHHGGRVAPERLSTHV
jgi:hypothetical protein